MAEPSHNETDVDDTVVTPGVQALTKRSAKLTFDVPFAEACTGNELPEIPPNTIEQTRHAMRVLEYHNVAGRDLTFVHEDGYQWSVPLFKATSFSTALAEKLKHARIRPVIMTINTGAIHPIHIDTAIEHWYRSDYELSSKTSDGVCTVTLKHSGPQIHINIPEASALQHLIIYEGAGILGDQYLANTAFCKFKTALSLNRDLDVLIRIVDGIFGVGGKSKKLREYDPDLKLRNLIVTYAYTWDKVYTEMGSAAYFDLFETAPEFARMLKEASFQSKRRFQVQDQPISDA
ncbi:hypothetical protein N0V90_001178 [Kalmusia sp. IMI 367209]|nr:hypothetical protein N0V90_001178 [Kalmusia sp. IMI 367209]